MSVTKLSLAALLLGASLTPALAAGGDTPDDRLPAYLQSIGQAPAAAPKLIEGRQAAAIAAPAAAPAAASAVDRFLEQRNVSQNR